MTRVLCLLALCVAGCASSHAAPVAYGAHSAPPRYAHAARQQTPAPQRSTRIDQTTPQPDWADGPGTPLSAYALQPAPRDPRRFKPHRVARGETFDSIARDYAIDARSLALLNFMQPPYALREGDVILLPAAARDGSGPPTSPQANVARPSVQSPTIPPQSASLTTPPQAGEQIASAPAPPNVHFSWPVHGEVLTHFGPQPGGARLDGVEIAADEGASVAAADDGEVVYAGSDLNAYGTLVLVRHDNGYVTAYGYGRRALVHEGQRVRKGQPIEEVGRVRDGATRLLFQVRRGREAIDPLPLLGAS